MTTALLLSPDVNQTVSPGVSHLCQQQRLMPTFSCLMKQTGDDDDDDEDVFGQLSLTQTATADQHLTLDSTHTHTQNRTSCLSKLFCLSVLMTSLPVSKGEGACRRCRNRP